MDDGYVIKDAQGNDKTANFTNVTTANGTLTVNAKAVTITTGGDSKAYDGTALTNATVGIEGLVDGESVTLATTGSQTEVGSSDNTYSITWGSAKEGNYTVTKSLGTLTVTKNTATVTLTAPSDSKTYDGTALTKTTGVTATGLPAGFTVEATATGSQTDAGSSANVVDNGYVIKDANGIDKTANFTNVTTADGTLTVNPKAVTITTGSDSKAYDGTALTEGTAEIEGLVDGESVTLTATGSQTEVGDSKNTYSITWDNAKASNYAVTDALGTLTVTTNDAAVTLTAPSDSKTYDGTALTKTTGVTATGLPAGFTVEATASGSQTDVGNSANVVNNGYVIKDANGNDKTANFTNITKADGTLTVNAKAVTITTGSDSKAYDGTALTEGTAEIEGLVDGESVTLATTGSQTEVGDSKNTYSITWDNAKASNYAVTDALGTLTVTTNDAAVTLTAPSDSKTYDGTALTKTTGVTATGLPAGFTVEATASGSQTDVGNSANVVDNGYVIKDANGNDKTANFTNVTTADGTLTVNAKAVTITTGSDSKAYDGTALTEGTAEIEGLVDGESVTLATTGSQTEVGDSKNTYSITWDNAKASNYAVTDALGTLTVTTNDAAVTLTAPSDSKTYDGTALTKTTGVTATGLPAGFTVEATASGSQTDVGNSANVVDNGYVIKDANGNDKTANFTNVTTADGTLTVNPKAVTVTTGSASKVYDGTALTNATVGIAGLVDGQSVTLVATGSQTRVGSSNNTYSITWDNATAANYKVIENLGKLTVRAGGGPNPTPPTTPDPTPGPGGPEEIIPEDGVVESITISERETPLSGGTTAAWALLNLLLTILTGIIMIALLIGYFTGRKREEEDRRTNRDRYRNQYEDESKLKRKGFLRLLSFIPLIVAVIVFILTEDMRNPMVFVDRWTIWMAVIAAVQVILALFCKKSYEEDEDNKEYWNLEKA
ncbi:MAG: beta strand repeat-containing protein [Eubacteriales bacterium]